MAATLFKEVSYSLNKLIEDIQVGEIGLPDLQRPFVWPNTKVRDLFDSMYKGFPVGYLLFWVNYSGNGARIIGENIKQKVPRLLIVDGQQRLTSLYAVQRGIPVLRDNYRHEKIRIAFRPRDQRFDVADAAIRRDPEYISDISELWSGEVPRNKFVKNFFVRLREKLATTEDEENSYSEAIDRLYDLQHYPFTALELSSQVDEERVAEVFVRINSQGTKLNQSDFILTLMSVYWDEGRTELEQFCKRSLQPSTDGPSSFNHFIQPSPDQLLLTSTALGFRRSRLKHVYSLLRGKDLETELVSEETREEQFKKLRSAQSYTLNLQHWHDFMKVLLRAGYRSKSMISSDVGLMYAYSLFLIGKQDFKVDAFELRGVIARWFFMTALTARYSTSGESAMEHDLSRLRAISSWQEFVMMLNRIIDDTLTEDYWNITLPNELDSSSAQSPALYAYHASQNLLDARVLFSKEKVADLLDPAVKSNKSALERHHLFPKNYLARAGISDRRDQNQIANYAFVEWEDNIDIFDQPPTAYVSQYLKRFSEAEIQEMYYHHALPQDWERMDYRDFLAVRRKLMAKVVRDGFSKLKS